MPAVYPFTEEQSRALINLRQRYEVWIEAERELRRMPYDLRRKEVNGAAYLYEISGRSGTGKSRGRWDEARQTEFDQYHAAKAAFKQRQTGSRAALDESSRLTRALRLPLLSSDAGPILREADRRGLLGSHLLVVGTNAMSAYSQEAGGIIRDIPIETEDFDLAWSAEEPSADSVVWETLKAVDPTFTVNTKREFQARNAKAFEVELLIAPSRSTALSKKDKPRPIPLPEQEWLLPGRRVDQVVACRDGSPARIVAPDPRWFALHKLWLSDKPSRNVNKSPKDRRQGLLLLDAIAEAMPLYPLDEAFAADLPTELVPYWQAWNANRPARSEPHW
jgi:hypothetical protein